MDIMKVMKLKGAWDKFQGNHPKFVPFVKAVSQNGMAEGTILEVNVTAPDGKTLATNVKIQKSDLELFEQIKNMMQP